MIFLLLATVCSAAIALVFKRSETLGLNRFAVTSANYGAALALAIAMLLVEGLPSLAWQGSIGEELPQVVQEQGRLSEGASLKWAIAVGLGAGCFFPLGFIVYQIAIRQHGVALAGAFSRMGVLIPLTISILFWREYPSVLKSCGIVLALVSICIVNWPEKGEWRRALRVSLIALLLLAGMAEFSHAIFENYALASYKGIFLLGVFSMAFAVSLGFTLRSRESFGRREVITGICAGTPNFFSSYFLVLALTQVNSSIAYPIFSAGAILLIIVGGTLFFRERMRKADAIAVAFTVIAIVLIQA